MKRKLNVERNIWFLKLRVEYRMPASGVVNTARENLSIITRNLADLANHEVTFSFIGVNRFPL